MGDPAAPQLDAYRRKRNFGKTPEPAPGPVAMAPPVGASRFVVQRHRATRLHYDFRLEIGGVLVSWAVPKGPTLDAGVRRMAIHVEDHPLDYFDFEGVIPGGEYGAGDVIVWDWGTWEPEAETPEPIAAVENGELKFRLHGEKLSGRFTIVRTSRRTGAISEAAHQGEREQWLLIHKRDETALAGWNAEDHPYSVKSARSNDEVKADVPAIDLSAARDLPMPTYIEPMKATLASQPFRDEDWLFEVKWDGYRVEAVVGDSGVHLFTRNGKDAEAYFPGLLTPATWIDAREAIVDGEVVALDDDGRPDFSLLQERISAGKTGGPQTLVYQIFDLLYLNGHSLLDVPLETRKWVLERVLRPTPQVRFAGHVPTEGIEFFEAAKTERLEGLVAKQRRSRYEPGRRSSAWLKVKVRPEQELVVGGWTPGKGSANALGALLVGVYEDGRLRFCGKVGSGFNAASRRELRGLLESAEVPAPVFDPAPPTSAGRRGGDLDGVRWTTPGLVVRAEFAGWTRDGLLRQAAYKGLDPGRDPCAVVRERPINPATAHAVPATPAPQVKAPTPQFATATAEEVGALAAMHAEGTWRTGGEELKLTNLDKVLFAPRDGVDEAPVTKRELVAYFAQIAPVMLPHLAERALNLHRFPNGAGAPGFWQKDVPASAPSWLTIWHETGVPDRKGREANDHLVADRAASLCWLANQAAFEIHAWTSILADPWTPTFALIDIDPGTGTTWAETLVLARLYRTALEHMGVRAYPKVTGSRGIQAWIPVERGRYTYAETSAWVEALSRAIGATVPDLVSWEWSKAERGGKARLDYTQNAPIKTLVAPYAVRPRPGAPVSAPIRWEELDDPDLAPDRWTIRNVVQRVAEVGDLWAGLQEDGQVLPAF